MSEVNITARQEEVVRLIARGMSNPEMAEALGISESTVVQHTIELRRKLGNVRKRDVPTAYLRLTGRDPFPRKVAA